MHVLSLCVLCHDAISPGYDIEYGGYPRVNKSIGPAGAGII